jgi:CBS domain-containing protein
VLPGAAVREAAAASAPLADFLQRRVWTLVEDSRRALQESARSRALAEQSLETPLRQVMRREPAMLGEHATIGDALRLMEERRIGSVLVGDGAGGAQGIFTRHDVIGRVSLPQRPLDAPLATVMSAPLQMLDVEARAHDAALLMSRHGFRHVPVVEQGRIVGIVSERDLFALQRLSINQLSAEIGAARDPEALRRAAAGIRQFARQLAGQGLSARALTELISHLNDRLTVQIVQNLAREDGIDLNRACWLAFGSEGRGEQTIATDQDNGLVFESDDPARDRPRWLAFGRRVNEALDACGYPLCKGGVMAGQPDCCLSTDEWRERFAQWIDAGSPEALLAASIYFDLRPLAGKLALAEPLREFIVREAAAVPRFIHQLAENGLQRRPPLNWFGGIETTEVEGRQTIDLKLQGTAIFVDAARLYALAKGVAATGTRARFEAVAQALRVDPAEGDAWSAGFEMLQMMRLQRQLDEHAAEPNRIDFDALNEIDRRVLKETLRVAKRLQQRIEMDWMR